MRLETLDDALRRAEDARKPIAADTERFRSDVARRETFHRQCLEAPRGELRADFLENAAGLFDARWAYVVRAAALSAADDLQQMLRYIRFDWRVAVPGCGVFVANFFVRSYRIEDGKPAAYDPFWIEGCVLRGDEYDALMARHATWAAGGDLRPDGSGPSDPLLPVRVPFGTAEEAARAPCGTCGASGYVVGRKDFCHWTEEDEVPYRQELKLLCLACPRIVTIAERSDPRPLRLHP